MTIEDVYNKLVSAPELEKISPLFKAFCLIYEIWASAPEQEQHISSLCDILDDLRKQQPEALDKLLDGVSEKNLILPTSLAEPEWLMYKKEQQELKLEQEQTHQTFVEQHQLPSIKEQAMGFLDSMYEFAASGFKTVTKEQYDARRAICESCQFFDPNGFAGLGRCRKCGCSSYKLNVATAQCPFGFWKSLD
jgi:hypothetical protein